MFRIPLFSLANSASPAFTCIASPALRVPLPRGLASSSSSLKLVCPLSLAPRRHELQHLTFSNKEKKNMNASGTIQTDVNRRRRDVKP